MNLDDNTLDYAEFWTKLNDLFPYQNYRKEQFSIISAIQKASSKPLLIDAETGSGKTAAVLSAILSKKEDKERIIIFTKMLGQMDAWFRELGLINDYNRTINRSVYSLVPLVGKSHICPLVTKETQKQFAQLGCSLFDCSHNVAYHITKNEYEKNVTYPKRIVSEIGENIKKDVNLPEILWLLGKKIDNFGCPFLAIKSALKYADIIITTYPFLINPELRELLFKYSDIDLGNTTVVIDEAHNLAKGELGDLSYKIIYRAIQEIGEHPILKKLQEYQEQPGLHTISLDAKSLDDLRNKGKRYLLQQMDKGYRDISFTLKVSEFLSHIDLCYLTADKKFTLYLKDPRTILDPIKLTKQMILISGTFSPLNYFANFLGLTDSHKITVMSEKIGKNRIILTTSDPKLSMKYQVRSRDSYLYYGEVINRLVEVIPGHVLVFAPNYELTAVLANLIGTKYIEQPNQRITKLINSVKAATEKVVVIAPARGKISEGIEFVKDDRSIISAVIIAGLPYPPPSRSLKEIIEEYSKFWGETAATSYMNYLQAIVTMKQALGRMIRSENDIGSWIILDNRISYMDVFPRSIDCKNAEQMIERLNYFYGIHNQR